MPALRATITCGPERVKLVTDGGLSPFFRYPICKKQLVIQTKETLIKSDKYLLLVIGWPICLAMWSICDRRTNHLDSVVLCMGEVHQNATEDHRRQRCRRWYPEELGPSLSLFSTDIIISTYGLYWLSSLLIRPRRQIVLGKFKGTYVRNE